MDVIDFYPRALTECELVMCTAEEAITNEEATCVCTYDHSCSQRLAASSALPSSCLSWLMIHALMAQSHRQRRRNLLAFLISNACITGEMTPLRRLKD